MKTFTLERQSDESGVSGVGIVLEGVEFGDGRVALRWYGADSSLVVFPSFAAFVRIHITSHPTNRSIIRYGDGMVLTQDQFGILR